MHVWQRWSSGHFHSTIWIRRCYNVSGLYFKCLDGELRTYREHSASYLRNRIQRIRNVLHVTGRRCYNIPGKSFKVLEEAVTTSQERLASYLQKISQRIRKVLQVTRRTCNNVSGNSGKLLEEKYTTHQEGRAIYLQVGRCCKYQERLACYLTKMLQHIRNITQVTWRRCDNVPGTSCKLLQTHLMSHPKCLQVFPKPTPSVPECPLNPPQVSPSVNLKICIPWIWFPKRTPCPTPSVSKCPLNPPQVSPSVPKCPQVSPKPTPSVSKC